MAIYLKNERSKAYPYPKMEKDPTVLRSIIFDCDGVLIDSEPLHFSAFKKVLNVDETVMPEEVYTEKYLALDDRGAITKFYQDQKLPLSEEKLAELLAEKNAIYKDMVKTEGVLAYPAVPEFVMAASQRYPLAVASGSRKDELELVLEAAGIRAYFEVIISADDVENGKPDPESYLKAVDALNRTGKRTLAIKPEECLVIEDSKYGVQSARSAGMKVVAVATSHPTFELSHADLVVPNLASLRMSQIEDLFQPPAPKPVPSPQNN